MPRYDLAAIQRQYRFHQVELPAFPGVLFTVSLEIATRRVYFAVDEMCRAIGIDTKAQRDKLAAITDDNGQPVLRPVPMPTAGGLQEKAALEFQQVGPWLLSIQERRVGDGRTDRLRLFQREAMRAVNLVLLGHVPAVPIKLPRGRPSLIEQLEERVAEAEREIAQVTQVMAVQRVDAPAFPANHGMMQAYGTCPHCGGPLLVQAGSLHVVVSIPLDAESEK